MFIELLFIHLTLKRKSLIIFTLYSASNYFRISYSLSIFHSCSCVYRLNPVWLANQSTPQKTGSSSHKIQNLFSSFPFCHWNGRLFFWTEHSFSGKPLLANIKEREKYINNINGRFKKKKGYLHICLHFVPDHISIWTLSGQQATPLSLTSLIQQ